MYQPGHLRELEMLFMFQCLPGERHPPRTMRQGREAIELVLSGHGLLDEDGALQPVGPGDLLWHQAGERTLCQGDPRDPYRCLALRVLVEPGSARPAPRHSHWGDLGAAATFSQEAVLQWTDPRTDRSLLLHRLYATLLDVATRSMVPAGLPAGLVRILARIDGEYARDLAVADLARTAGWRPQRLHEACREHLGSTPHRLIHERRLRAVRELLVATDLPLADIAARCGFASAATLCRGFRQAAGTSPAAWRHLHR